MTLRINKESGKGDRRRATQDDTAYFNNYDLIFGKKPSIPALPETVVDGIEQYMNEQYINEQQHLKEQLDDSSAKD